MGEIRDKFLKGTISIQEENSEAAAKIYGAKIAEAQANKRAEFDKAMLDFGDKALLYLAGIAVALAVGGIAKLLKGPLKKAFTNTAAKTTSKVVAKKAASKAVAKKVATEAAKKTATKAVTKTVATKAATKGSTGILSKIASIIPGVGNAGKAGAGGLMSGIAKGGMKGIMGNLGKGLLKGGPIGLLGTVASMAGDYVGGKRKEEGMAEGDRSKVNQGKALQAGATAVEYAGYGAAIGSIIPGIGTAVGGAIGGVVGGIKGIWDGWFSDDAKAKDEELKKVEEQNKVVAAQKVLSERDIATQEDMKKNSTTLATAAQDTGFFQAAMVAQLVEATRLLDIIAFGSNAEKVTKEIFLDGKKITRLNYDRASTLYNTMSTQKAAAK